MRNIKNNLVFSIVSLIMTFFALQIIPTDSESLYSNNYLNSETKEEIQLEQIKGYDVIGNNYISNESDPWLIFKSDSSKINTLDFKITSNALSFPLDVYFGDDINSFSEKNKVSITCFSDKNETISLPKSYQYLRIDLGNQSDMSFKFEKLKFSKIKKNYFTLTRILIFILLFFSIYSLEIFFYRRKKSIQKYFSTNKFWIRYGFNLFVVICSILIFCVLYSSFIFGDSIYIYPENHIGGDTIDVYYPAYYLISSKLHSGSFSFFDFRIGLGASIFTLFTGFSIFDILIFLFSPENIHIGILLITALKYIVISFFSVKLFNQYFTDKKIIFSTSILWTFCSFTVMWGQHYSFATAMVYFTVFIYFLNKFLAGEKRSSIKLLITCSLICTSYYFFWMFGIFSVVYSIYYCYRKGYNFKKIFNRVFLLGVIALIGMLLSMYMLLPEIKVFLSSARNISSNGNIDLIFDSRTIISLMSRFLSSEFIGRGYIVGRAYSGSINYYEMAFLSTTIISIPALYYYFIYKSKSIFDRCFQMIFFLIILSPYANYLFTFNINAFRWTYIYIFIFILAIGYFINDLGSLSKKQTNVLSILFIITLISMISVIILYQVTTSKISINTPIMCIIFIFFCIYVFILLFHSKIKYSQLFFIFFMLIESLFMDYYSINSGGFANKNTFFKQYYFDDSIECIQSIKAKDQGLFRINKNFSSRLYNDSQIQDFYGLSSYNSFNSQEYLNAYDYYRCNSNLGFKHSNYLSISTNDSYLNNLMSTKYLLLKDEYGHIHTEYNNRAIPFGFLYDKKVNAVETFPNSLVNTFGYTTDDSLKLDSIPSSLLVSEYNLNDLNEATNSRKTTLLLRPNNSFDYSGHFKINTNSINAISINLYDLNNEIIASQSRTLFSGENVFDFSFYLPEYNDEEVYIEIFFTNDDYYVEQASFNFYDSKIIDSQIDLLRSQSVKGIEFNKDVLQGSITNNSEKKKMLFLPILFSNSWHVKIDNVNSNIFKINNSFIGVEIPKGTHEIKLIYIQDGLIEGLIITTVIFMLLLLGHFKFKLFSLIDESIERRN